MMLNIAFFCYLFYAICCQKITTSEHPACPDTTSCVVRTYYVAATEEDWDFAPSGIDHISDTPIGESVAFTYLAKYQNRIGGVYIKAIFHEYTDDTFSTRVSKPSWLGNLGPIIRTQVGEVVEFVLFNNATKSYGIHPHGVHFLKTSEGADYDGINGAGDVEPGNQQTYSWSVPARSGPGPNDSNSILFAYHSHLHDPDDIFSGLIGPILVYKQGFLSSTANIPTGDNVEAEFILNFQVYNENVSPYLYKNIQKFAPELNDRLLPNPDQPFEIGGDQWQESNMMHSINGRMYGNLAGLDIPLNGTATIRWHLMAFGNEVDLHTAHWHSHTILYDGHRKDVVELLSATFRTVEMVVDNVGTWLLHCHVIDHQIGGMSALYRVYSASDFSTMLSMDSFVQSKTYNGVPPAPRPPKAVPILGINKGCSLVVSWILLFIVLNKVEI